MLTGVMLKGFTLKEFILKKKEKKAFCLGATALVFFWAFLWCAFFMPVQVTVNDAGLVYTVESRAASVGEFFIEQGIEVAFHDKVYPGIYAHITEDLEIVIERTVPYVLNQPEMTATYYTTASTVLEALEEIGVPLNGAYFILPLLEDPICPAIEITLVHRRVVTEFVEEKIQYEIESKEDLELQKGRHLVIKEGEPGLREFEYTVVYAGDEEYSRELVQERVIKAPVAAVVHIGTKDVRPSVSGMIASRGERIGDYSSEGIASWYGNEFHGRRTSSGEVFDQYAFTAAHRYLPFGTVVRVTSYDTGKSVVVRINDRGPMKPERIIDLSRGAAQALGLESQGIGMVKIETIREEVNSELTSVEITVAEATASETVDTEVETTAAVTSAPVTAPAQKVAATMTLGAAAVPETAGAATAVVSNDETDRERSAGIDSVPAVTAEVSAPLPELPGPLTDSSHYGP